VIAIALTGSACRQDMRDQQKCRCSTAFFGDIRSARPLLAGTVMGPAPRDPFLETGKIQQRRRHDFPFGGRGGHGARTQRFDIFRAVPRPPEPATA
jgi:hypothetical protein